ncbi:MAG TPA: hypothetical protein VGE05_11285 [Novosphingobium sp.]
MTNVFFSQFVAMKTTSSTTTPQMLTTGMSFEEALRAAHDSGNRMFGFDELGMFGLTAARASSGNTIKLSARPDKPVAESGCVTAPPKQDTVEDGGQIGTTPGGQISISESGLEIVPRDPALPRFADSGRQLPAASAPLVNRSEPVSKNGYAKPEIGASTSAALRAQVVTRSPCPPDRAHLMVIVEGDKTRLVVRDWSITEEDRALLEGRVDALLQDSGLTRSELMLNGSNGSARRADRKES